MNRRALLLGGAARLVVLTSIAGAWAYHAYPDNYCDGPNSNNDLKELQHLNHLPRFNRTTMWQNIYRHAPFTLVGDTFHKNAHIGLAFYSGENLDAITNAGIKHIFIEDEPSATEIFDAALLNYPDLPSLRQNYDDVEDEDISKTLAYAMLGFYAECKNRGISFHAIDNRDKVKTEGDVSYIWDFLNRFFSEYKDRCGDNPTTLPPNAYISYIARNPIGWIKYQYNANKIIKIRLDDTALHERILKAANGEKSVVFFGAGHFGSHKTSLKSFLGPDAISLNIAAEMSPDITEDKPDFVYFLDQKEGIQTGLLPINPDNVPEVDYRL